MIRLFLGGKLAPGLAVFPVSLLEVRQSARSAPTLFRSSAVMSVHSALALGRLSTGPSRLPQSS